MLGALVFYQLANKTGSSTGTGLHSYNTVTLTDNGRVHYYHDSYRISSDSIYVEIGGKRFK